MANNKASKLTDQDIIDSYMWLMYNKSWFGAGAWEQAMLNVQNEMKRRGIKPPKEEEY